ncbi:MAG: GTP-binding protein, partial [bacterium]
TLLNRLIEYYKSKQTVLLINEFGKVGIDGELLIEGNYEMVELNKGSLFCICVRTDFITEVEKIARQIQPELLIIEATGLADTSEMEKMLALPNLRDHIQLQACLCLVDSQNFLKIKDILKAPVSQIRSADLVLVNKIDLVGKEQVEKVIKAVREISNTVSIITTTFAEFPLNKLDEIIHPESIEIGMPDEGRPDPVISITLEGIGSFTRPGWEQFRSLVEPNLMRLKGFISLEDQSYYIDVTMDRWSMRLSEKTNNRMNRLVLIGQKLNQEQIEESFLQQISIS